MTLVSWDAVTTNCDGTPAIDLAFYEVLSSYEASVVALPDSPFHVASQGTAFLLSMSVFLFPDPGQVLYMRVRAWDLAGNNSDAGCPDGSV